MRILVTGAAGFVGRHLMAELERYGHDVVGVDYPEGDLAQPGAVRRIIEEAKPDRVAHLAARYGRLLCRDEPHRAVADNAAATTELAAVCAERRIGVLYTSSSEVYGDHGLETVTERSVLRTPTTIYGLSKLWGEQALQLYLPADRLCVARMNMLYGPGQQAGYGRCALATFIADALAGRPLIVHRGASRSWLYISDAVVALRILIENNHAGVFNVGNGEERLSMTELARLVLDEVGGGQVEMINAPAGQIRHKNYDSSKVRAVTDWQPTVSINEGTARTVAWQANAERTAA